MKYLVFLLVLAGCKPAGPLPTATPAWQFLVGTSFLGFLIGYQVAEWLTRRKYHGLFLDYTNMIERHKKALDERITAMLKEMDELKQTINRLKNDRRY
jgi:hypothetical protein